MRWSVGHDRPSVHNHGVPTGAAAAFMMRPTTAPSQSTSKSSSFHSPEGRDADARLRTNVTRLSLQSRCAASFDHLVGAHGGRGHVCTTAAGDRVISPLPVALVEGRRREQRCPPSTTDSLGARKAKVLHQVNQVVAQSKIRRHPVDRFYARDFDLRQGGCRPHRRRLLRMRCERRCHSQPSKQTDELASPHSITSSARASNFSGKTRPRTLVILKLISVPTANPKRLTAGRESADTRSR
jgi:hypothetical protein